MIDYGYSRPVRNGRKVFRERDLPVPVGVVRLDTAVGSKCIVCEMVREHLWVDFHVLWRVLHLHSDVVVSDRRGGREVNWSLRACSLVSGQTEAIVPIVTVLCVVQGVGEGDSSCKRADNV